MFTRPFRPGPFLHSVSRTDVFADYCHSRGIPFMPGADDKREDDAARWRSALAELSRDAHAEVELELATVNELSGRDGNQHLLEAAAAGTLPADAVARGGPVALWFLLHQPDVFREVFLHHQVTEAGTWRVADAPAGLHADDLEDRAEALGRSLRQFFRIREGTGRFCTVSAHRPEGACCFVAQIADRLQFVEAFGEDGKPALQRLRPAVPVLFAYYPQDGTVLCKSHLRSADRVADLLRCFGESVLHAPVTDRGPAFDLDRLKVPFHPLADAGDMEMVRVKALHLRHPQRSGRRLVKFETLATDEPSAVEQLLRAHVAADRLDDLSVCHAELQVRLRVEGRAKNYSIRLWPDRCSLNQTPLADRFRACLKRWGLANA